MAREPQAVARYQPRAHVPQLDADLLGAVGLEPAGLVAVETVGIAIGRRRRLRQIVGVVQLTQLTDLDRLVGEGSFGIRQGLFDRCSGGLELAPNLDLRRPQLRVGNRFERFAGLLRGAGCEDEDEPCPPR